MKTRFIFLMLFATTILYAQKTIVAFKAPDSTPIDAVILVGSSSWQGGWDETYGLPNNGYELTKVDGDDYYRAEVPEGFCNDGIRFILNEDVTNRAQWEKAPYDYDVDSWGNADYAEMEGENTVYYFNQFVKWEKDEIIIETTFQVAFKAPASTPSDAKILIGSSKLHGWENYGLPENGVELTKVDGDEYYRAEINANFCSDGVRIILVNKENAEDTDNIAVWKNNRGFFDTDSWGNADYMTEDDVNKVITYTFEQFYEWKKNVEDIPVTIVFNAPSSTPSDGLIYVGSWKNGSDYGIPTLAEEMKNKGNGVYEVTTLQPFAKEGLRFVLIDEDTSSFNNIALYLKANTEIDEYESDSWDHILAEDSKINITKFVKWTNDPQTGSSNSLISLNENYTFSITNNILNIQVDVLSQISISDMTGKILASKTTDQFNILLNRGLYIVSIVNETGKAIEKIIIK